MTLNKYDRNPQKRWIAEFLADRFSDACQLCRVREVLLEIDHIDNNPNNWDPKNLRLLCHPCNISERNRIAGQRSMQPVSVKTERASTSATAFAPNKPLPPSWASREGDRGEKQRQKFNVWLYDQHTGLAYEEGVRFSPKGLAKAAVHGVGLIDGKLGSSVTYDRYVEDDFAGGLWRICPDDPLMIERTGKPFPFPENRPPMSPLQNLEMTERR